MIATLGLDVVGSGGTQVLTVSGHRRGVIAFNVAASIPAGAVITRVDLTLNMSRTIALLQPVSLHRLLADWGEGTSDATFEEGGGAAATAGDATWIHRFFNTTSLRTGAGAAGDFATAPSTTVQVGAIGAYIFLSTAGMMADVQGWLDNPGTNFGWILIGNESSISTTKRFDSRNNPLASVRPMLTIEFSTGQAGPVAFPTETGSREHPSPWNTRRAGTSG